jgi:hypothetical protein
VSALLLRRLLLLRLLRLLLLLLLGEVGILEGGVEDALSVEEARVGGRVGEAISDEGVVGGPSAHVSSSSHQEFRSARRINDGAGGPGSECGVGVVCVGLGGDSKSNASKWQEPILPRPVRHVHKHCAESRGTFVTRQSICTDFQELQELCPLETLSLPLGRWLSQVPSFLTSNHVSDVLSSTPRLAALSLVQLYRSLRPAEQPRHLSLCCSSFFHSQPPLLDQLRLNDKGRAHIRIRQVSKYLTSISQPAKLSFPPASSAQAYFVQLSSLPCNHPQSLQSTFSIPHLSPAFPTPPQHSPVASY